MIRRSKFGNGASIFTQSGHYAKAQGRDVVNFYTERKMVTVRYFA